MNKPELLINDVTMEEQKSVIIIGSGLGGLACGLILAKNGYKITILEQSNQAGGCLQCFSRRGVKFETGMHFIGSVDRDQSLWRILRYLGIEDKLQLSRLDTDGYDEISLDGKIYKFANGKDAFIETMASEFPHERENLKKLMDLVEQVASASSLHSLNVDDADLAITMRYQMLSMNEVIDSIIDDSQLRKVLAGNLPLYAAQLDKTPFSTYAFIMDFYNRSAFRFVGGSDHIAMALIDEIKKYGGEVHLLSKVNKIICDDTHATGVETDNGVVYNADYVISGTHPARTLEMLDTKLIRPAFRSRVSNLPNTAAGFSVYLQFKKDSVPYRNSNFYGYRNGTPWDCEFYTEETWPKGYLYMHFCHEKSPVYAESGVILSYMSIDELNEWKETHVGHRGKEYNDFKKRKAEKLLDVLEHDFPGIKENIEHYYTSTPLTYRDYTGTEGGSMYGIAKDITSSASRVPHKTRIPNLFLTGQNINSHGMLGVLVGSIVTCAEFLGTDKIYQQIIDACNE